MKANWTDKRPNGQPIEPGTFAYVMDAEDGTHPVWVYGKTVEDVLSKIALQNMHAQSAIARRSAPAAEPPAPIEIPSLRRISSDEVMRATADLQNPAKSGEAIATLLESATGIDIRKQALKDFADLAMRWQASTPDFYPHPGNKQLISANVMSQVGGNMAAATEAHFRKAFDVLKRQGVLFERPAEDENNSTPPLPDENPVQRERPRGTRFATHARGTSFAPQLVKTRTLKYTEEQIRKMPLDKERALIEANDPDYAAAVDYYFGSAEASA